VYLNTGKTEEAIAEMKQAMDLAPNSDESYRRLGRVYGETGRKQEAIAAYQKAVDINPYYWFNYNWLGVTLARFGEDEKALDAFRRVTELSPDGAPGYNNLGGGYLQLGRWNEAVAAYRKSLSISERARESNADAQSNLGVALYYLGLYSEAAKAMEKAVEMEPNRHDLAADLGDAYRQMGQRDKALAAYDTAIRLAFKAYQVNSQDPSTLGGLAIYYAKKGDLNRAKDFITRARAIDGNDNALIYYEALIQAISGNQAEALKALRNALQKGYPPEFAKSEPEFASLRSSPEFEKLIKEFSRKRN
jgi:superkiller protein 3